MDVLCVWMRLVPGRIVPIVPAVKRETTGGLATEKIAGNRFDLGIDILKDSSIYPYPKDVFSPRFPNRSRVKVHG